MLTFDFQRLAVGPDVRLLDLGCGAGRHAFEAYRLGADVVAADLDVKSLESVADMLAALANQYRPSARSDQPALDRPPAVSDPAALMRSGPGWSTVRADALQLPFPTASFDRVIVSEVLEHIPADRQAIAEVARVLKPGGIAAVSVPRWWPEQVCWTLSADYHTNPGGHCRIYRGADLEQRLADAGFRVWAKEHSHALHTPYWWLKCLFGVRRDRALVPTLYHQLLVWDLVHRPRWLRNIEGRLNPILGKSLVLYLVKPARDAADPSPGQRDTEPVLPRSEVPVSA